MGDTAGRVDEPANFGSPYDLVVQTGEPTSIANLSAASFIGVDKGERVPRLRRFVSDGCGMRDPPMKMVVAKANTTVFEDLSFYPMVAEDAI